MTVSSRLDNMRVVRAPRGTERTAKSWLTEAPLRMLMNNLDPEVAERPGELVVYGGIGRAARDWQAFDRIVETLRRLEDDETLLVQSGKPVGVFRTHADAPRVLIANSNLVPRWATWEHFHELDRKGLMMYGQMTAGSWIYIGSQGIVQGTYETFVEVGRRHYGGSLAGKWILTAGLGGMGGAQPLAATMAGASMLAVECRPSAIEFRLRTGYLDVAGQRPRRGAGDRRARGQDAQGGVGRPARQRRPKCCRSWLRARRQARPGHRPDLARTTRSTATCRRAGRWSNGRSGAVERPEGRRARGQAIDGRARPGDARTFQRRRADRRLRQQHPPGGARRGRRRRVRLPGLRARLHPAAVLPRRRGRSAGWRCRAIPRTSSRPTRRSRSCSPTIRTCTTGSTWRAARIHFQGLPARICWVGLGERHRLGLAFNEMVAHGRAEGADRHRPRPPRLRLGRQPEPRDRGDEGRLRRGLGLAAAERAAQLRPAARPGCRSTTAAASAWAIRSTPAWSSCATAPKPRRGASRACCGTTRRPASCATPTRATRTRSLRQGEGARPAEPRLTGGGLGVPQNALRSW